MNVSKHTLLLGLVSTTVGSIAIAAPAYSATIIGNLNGSLANADAIAFVDFTTPDLPSSINFQTTSYSAVNFSPVLTLFTDSGTYLNEFTDVGDLNFDIPLSNNPDSPYNGTIKPLTSYRAVISAFGNYSVGNFNAGFSGGGDFFGRGSAYALTISTPTTVAVPEPSSLIGTAIAGFGVVLLKRKLSARSRQLR
jgi:hypothetical protein